MSHKTQEKVAWQPTTTSLVCLQTNDSQLKSSVSLEFEIPQFLIHHSHFKGKTAQSVNSLSIFSNHLF